jgi:phenylalanyl-tRNA synthetase beta chain
MAVVEFNRKDFENLVGKKLSDSELTEEITMMGFPLEKIEGEKIFYEVFPNRPDMLSVEGFARSVRYFLGIDRKMQEYSPKPSGAKLFVDNSVNEVRPFVVAAVVEKVKLTDDFIASLMQVQEKLHETLGRKRKKVAIGVHDFDKVKPPFTYKAVGPKEMSFVPLDMTKKLSMEEILKEHEKGKKYASLLDNAGKYPVITDRNNEVLSFPPIINGDLTRVTENTRRLFIDITGTSQQAVNQALNIITTALMERGCVVKTVEIYGKKKFKTPDLTPGSIKVDLDYVNRILGVDLDQKQFQSLLTRMGLGFRKNVLIPAYRTDIMHQIDIAEDLAIGYGYQNFKPEIPKVSTIATRMPGNEFLDSIREILVGSECQEVLGMILTNETDEFSKMNQPETEACSTANPTTIECTMMRKSIMPSLLRVLGQNKNKEYPQKIFEAGSVVFPDKNTETGASFSNHLGCAVSHSEAGYEDVSSILDVLLRNLGISYSLRKSENRSLASGRSAEIIISGKPAGVIGELSPLVLENWKLEKPVAAFEIDMEMLIKK